MGAIKVHEFTTLDGSVGVPMWTADFPWTDQQTEDTAALTRDAHAILLGRTTYEMFAPGWSQRTADDDPGAPFFNDTRKYVVSSTLTEPSWGPATVLPYDAARIARLKDEVDGDVYVSGSGTLVRALLADGLVDELHLFVYPVGLGEGPYLVPPGTPKIALGLLSATPYENGVVHLTYGPAGS
ncbi:Dihydrofolate reductase [Microlunatus sagamiharensis]|uniref:Dihydrofolate reductase n=1 Tax=Microlunatus sagamiharensis TaxID=546874 RepID=A0A1H2MDJ0_9ACTN|nr:dihydrofolate reductase family protein [Microlunatus sagamiharensis]SDU91192.1 Dihydrofolate reductase [Microlunatus sagamiharensis]